MLIKRTEDFEEMDASLIVYKAESKKLLIRKTGLNLLEMEESSFLQLIFEQYRRSDL